jgi:hypothetical protein
MSPAAERVVIGMDPHKRSVTIEVMAADETILGGSRFATDAEGYRSMVNGPMETARSRGVASSLPAPHMASLDGGVWRPPCRCA